MLGAVKTEFNRFGDVLETTQQRLEQAGSELDKLVGVRTRAIRRRLAQVGELPETDAAALQMCIRDSNRHYMLAYHSDCMVYCPK